MSEVIRRFDEVLSQKASKVQILELENACESKYLSKESYQVEKEEVD